MDIGRRIEKLENAVNPYQEPQMPVKVIMAGEPEPHMPEGGMVIQVVSEEAKALTLRILTGEGTGR